jgi:hypothetical protein
MMDVMPMIIKMLIRLLPKTLAMARSVFLSALAKILTISSGSDVPEETIVRPITMPEIFIRWPMELAPSTSQFAPKTRITNPKKNRNMSIGESY